MVMKGLIQGRARCFARLYLVVLGLELAVRPYVLVGQHVLAGFLSVLGVKLRHRLLLLQSGLQYGVCNKYTIYTVKPL